MLLPIFDYVVAVCHFLDILWRFWVLYATTSVTISVFLSILFINILSWIRINRERTDFIERNRDVYIIIIIIKNIRARPRTNWMEWRRQAGDIYVYIYHMSNIVVGELHCISWIRRFTSTTITLATNTKQNETNAFLYIEWI